MKDVVYISGAITGQDNYKENFAEAEKVLSAAGYIVLNPAVLPEGLTRGEYMRICMAMIDAADILVMLPGWEESEGAKCEFAYGKYAGKKGVLWKSCRICRYDGLLNGRCENKKASAYGKYMQIDESCEGWTFDSLRMPMPEGEIEHDRI